jgi:hypothetical protein
MKTTERLMSPDGVGRRFLHNGSVSSKEGIAMIKSVFSGNEPVFDVMSDEKG